MKLKLSVILILGIGVGLVLSTSIPEKISDKMKKAYEYVNPPEPTYWEEFKQALSDMNPFGHRASREWCDAKCRVEEVIREHNLDAKDAKEEARNIVEKLRESLNRGAQKVGEGVHRMGEAAQTGAFRMGEGAHRVGEIAHTAIYKTWHLLLHTLLAGFWLLLGALAYSGIQMYLDKRTFNKQLAAPLSGPVVLSKIFHVYGTEDTQKKFQDYWTNTAQQFFTRQPGLRKFSLIRGVNVGSNCWCHMSEWNSVEDLRRAVNQPEIAELKKRMPKSFYSKRCISQIVTTGKGGAESARGEGDVRSEGLRQRGGPGTQTTS